MARKMTQKQRQLIMKNYNLMLKFIDSREKKGAIPDHLKDDFKSDLAWALCNSAIKFDESMGFKFSTYAYGGFHICCTNFKDRKEPLYQRNNFLAQKKVNHMLKDTTNKKHLIEESLSKLIDNTKLTKKEKIVLREYYLEEKTMEKIGEENDVTKARISQIRQQALEKLQRAVGVKHLTLDDFYE